MLLECVQQHCLRECVCLWVCSWKWPDDPKVTRPGFSHASSTFIWWPVHGALCVNTYFCWDESRQKSSIKMHCSVQKLILTEVKFFKDSSTKINATLFLCYYDFVCHYVTECLCIRTSKYYHWYSCKAYNVLKRNISFCNDSVSFHSATFEHTLSG